ncbi:MAG: MFS transporter [Emergencia sp.]
MKFSLTPLERSWVLYDVGNSAFVLLTSTILPIFFNYLADLDGISSVDYLAYWGYAASVVTLIVALLGPVLGAVSDIRGFKKPVFTICMLTGCLGCAALGLAGNWIWFLAVFILAKTGFSASLIFYDSMLTDVCSEQRMDSVSSRGYAYGYIGSCIPFVICLTLVLGCESLGLSMVQAMGAAFAVTSVWWLICTLPLLRRYRQIYYVDRSASLIRSSFSRLFSSFREIGRNRQILLFLIAFFFYIDGVYTIIDMATAYGQALGFDSTSLLLALLLTQIVAFPCSIIFGRLVLKIPAEKLISVCILAYFCIAVFAMFMDRQIHFWILAVLVGGFQGGIQALSRSYFAKIIPPEKSGEYFGILDICGKGASFTGTTLVSVVSQLTGSINLGVGAISILFLAGFFIFRLAAARSCTGKMP